MVCLARPPLHQVGTKRFDSELSGDREVQRTMLELLNQLDGFEASNQIKVVMATNRIDILDPGLLRPGRMSAGSSDSILLVARITLTSVRASKPSSWLSSSSIVRWISFSPPEVESYRLVPTASISSIKTMVGACSSATRKSSRTRRGPSPRYFWISSEPVTRRNVADVWLATAFASSVLPVPGSP